MYKYQFLDNAGKVQDVIWALDLTEAIEFAAKHDLEPCTIKELGPVSTAAWAEWLDVA